MTNTPNHRCYRRDFCKLTRAGGQFELTFEQWHDLWQVNDNYSQRGIKPGQYRLARLDDSLPWDLQNTCIERIVETPRDVEQQVQVTRTLTVDQWLAEVRAK